MIALEEWSLNICIKLRLVGGLVVTYLTFFQGKLMQTFLLFFFYVPNESTYISVAPYHNALCYFTGIVKRRAIYADEIKNSVSDNTVIVSKNEKKLPPECLLSAPEALASTVSRPPVQWRASECRRGTSEERKEPCRFASE